MHYVYCLQYKRSAILYYGYTINLRRRVAEHMARNKGWRLAYYEAYTDESDARRRERALKHYGQARSRLKVRIIGSLRGKVSAG